MVWRMQTLAAAHGIYVFVPSRNGLQGSVRGRNVVLSTDVRRMIDQSDCILAMIAGVPGAFVQAELTYALSRGKIVIPILREDIPQPAFLNKMPHVFRFSPANPGMVEAQVIAYLRQQKVNKDNRQAIGGLILLGMGLLMWSAFSEK